MRNILLAQEIFCETVKLKSFYQGARSSHVSEEKAERLLDELEAALGLSLFEVRKKGQTTPAGLKFFRKWSPSISQLRLMSSQPEVSSGTLRFAFPFTTGAAVFAPLTSLFAERYPRVKFDIQLATGSALPVWYNTDLRVVHDVYNYEDVKEFFLADAVRILCAAPAWIKDHPVSRPKDLERYPVFGARDAVEHRSIRFTRGNKEEAVLFHPQVVCRNNLAALHCALTEKGAALSVPRFLAEPFLKSGELVRILPDWNVSSLSLRAIVPNQDLVNPIIEAWVKYVQEALSKQKENFQCQPR